MRSYIEILLLGESCLIFIAGMPEMLANEQENCMWLRIHMASDSTQFHLTLRAHVAPEMVQYNKYVKAYLF